MSGDRSLGRPYWTLWGAFSASNLGDGLSLVSLPLLAISFTDDPKLIAAVATFQFLPFLVLGLPAGVLIDRFDRRWTAAMAQGLRALVFVALVVLLRAGADEIGLLMVAAFLIGSSEVVTDGGLPALVRKLVRPQQLELANSRLMATQRATNAFIGPPLGAVLFEVDTSLPFAAAAVVALLSVVGLLQLPGNYRPEQSIETASFVSRTTAGVRYVWAHPVLRPLAVAVGTFSFVGAATTAMFVVLATERFGIGSVGFGVMLSVSAAAAVLMTFLVPSFIDRTSHSSSMRFSIVVFCLTAIVFSVATHPAAAFAAAFVLGLSDPAWNVVSSTVRQRLVPDEVFGRMMTAYLFIAWGLKPVGALLGGVIAAAWGPQWVWVLATVMVGSILITGRRMFALIDDAMAE